MRRSGSLASSTVCGRTFGRRRRMPRARRSAPTTRPSRPSARAATRSSARASSRARTPSCGTATTSSPARSPSCARLLWRARWRAATRPRGRARPPAPARRRSGSRPPRPPPAEGARAGDDAAIAAAPTPTAAVPGRVRGGSRGRAAQRRGAHGARGTTRGARGARARERGAAAPRGCPAPPARRDRPRTRTRRGRRLGRGRGPARRRRDVRRRDAVRSGRGRGRRRRRGRRPRPRPRWRTSSGARGGARAARGRRARARPRRGAARRPATVEAAAGATIERLEHEVRHLRGALDEAEAGRAARPLADELASIADAASTRPPSPPAAPAGCGGGVARFGCAPTAARAAAPVPPPIDATPRCGWRSRCATGPSRRNRGRESQRRHAPGAHRPRRSRGGGWAFSACARLSGLDSNGWRCACEPRVPRRRPALPGERWTTPGTAADLLGGPAPVVQLRSQACRPKARPPRPELPRTTPRRLTASPPPPRSARFRTCARASQSVG